MKLNPKYDYKPITAETKKSGSRTYLTPSGGVPSVTTILSKTKDMTFLKEWKKRVGEKEADKIVKRSINHGNIVHKNLENYILEGTEPVGDLFSKLMTKKIIDNGLSKVDEIWGCEVSLFAEGLYAGTTDLVGVHTGDEAIMDFKNARSFRKPEWVTDYGLQTVAYAIAHNEMFDTNIRKGVIMLATQNGHYQEFVFEGEEFDRCCEEWAKRVETYYAKYGIR